MTDTDMTPRAMIERWRLLQSALKSVDASAAFATCADELEAASIQETQATTTQRRHDILAGFRLGKTHPTLQREELDAEIDRYLHAWPTATS